MAVGEIVAIIGVGISLVGALGGLMGVSFKLGGVTKSMEASTNLGIKTYNLVSKVDDRIDGIDLALKDKADRKEVDELRLKINTLETEHRTMCRKDM